MVAGWQSADTHTEAAQLLLGGRVSESGTETKETTLLKCSFCGKNQKQVRKLIAGPGVYICDECIDLCVEIIEEEKPSAEQEAQIAADPETPATPSPRQIYDELGKRIFGQSNALRVIAVSVFRHYQKMAMADPSTPVRNKDNLLLIGPTGSGKTLIALCLASFLKVPIAIMDTTTLTEAGYVGEDVDSIPRALLREAGGNQSLAEKGIVFLDEIDKIARTSSQNRSITRDVSGEGVQQALLTMLAGLPIDANLTSDRKHPNTERTRFQTKDILFIGGGTFDGIQRSADARQGIRYEDEKAVEDPRRAHIEPSKCTQLDLELFGLTPEFAGRFTTITELRQLKAADYERIIRDSPDSIVREYRSLFQRFGVELEIEERAISIIATSVSRERASVRGLRRAIESILMDALFVLPENSSLTRCVITANAGLKPSLRLLDRSGGEIRLHHD